MARKHRQQVIIDQGPPERRQHNTVAVEQGADRKARLRILDQTEPDRLLLKRLITLDQHTAAEHLYRDIIRAGYFPTHKWALDTNIRGDVQSLSNDRAETMMKISLARIWLLKRAGRRTTEFLFGVLLGERKVPDAMLPAIRLGLDKYQQFEEWWHGGDNSLPLPSLLDDLPADIKRSRPLHDQVA